MEKKDEFLSAIANVESYGLALENLMSRAMVDHFDSTLEGAIKEIDTEDSPWGGAYWWMNDHYDSVAAVIYAARKLAESMRGMAVDLYNTASDLVPDDSIHT